MGDKLLIVIAVVLIWHGIWSVFDIFNRLFSENLKIGIAIISIILGLAIFYWADKDLEDII